MRRGDRRPNSDRDELPSLFQPLHRMPQQQTLGRGHVLIDISPDSIHTVPKYKDHWDRHAGTSPNLQISHPLRVPREVRLSRVHIKTTPGPPVTCRARRLAPDLLAIAKTEFDVTLRQGTARRSDGPWSSALHLVPKKDNV